MSRLRFSISDVRREPCAWQGDQRQPLRRVEVGLGRHSLEQPRHEVDLHVERLELADRLECGLVRVARERDDHPLDVEQFDVQRDVSSCRR